MARIGIGIGLGAKSRVKVFDSFNRVDNASSLGNTDTGQAWSNILGTFGITTNMAKGFVSGGNLCAVLTGVSNIDVSADCIASGDLSVLNTLGLAIRCDATLNNRMNLWIGNQIELRRIIAGVSTVIATYPYTWRDGIRNNISIKANGNLFTVSLNGAPIINISDDNALKTGYAYSQLTAYNASAIPGHLIDNYKAEAI